MEERTLAEMEADVERRLCCEDEPSLLLDHREESDETDHWLRALGWPRWFRHMPMPLIAAAASIPAKGCDKELYLGEWHGISCVSSLASEKALQLIVTVTPMVLLRCQETLQSTPRTLRCCFAAGTPPIGLIHSSLLRSGRSGDTPGYGRNAYATAFAFNISPRG